MKNRSSKTRVLCTAFIASLGMLALPSLDAADEPSAGQRSTSSSDFIAIDDIPSELWLSKKDTAAFLKEIGEGDVVKPEAGNDKKTTANGGGWKRLDPRKQSGVGVIMDATRYYFLTMQGKWSPQPLTQPIKEEAFYGPTGTPKKKVNGANACAAIVHVDGRGAFAYPGKTIRFSGVKPGDPYRGVSVWMNDKKLKDNSNHPSDPMSYQWN